MFKAKDYSKMFFSAPIKGWAECYASLQTKFARIPVNCWSHDAGKAWHIQYYTTQKYQYNVYYEYMCLCWVSTLFGMLCCLFSNCNQNSATRLQSL